MGKEREGERERKWQEHAYTELSLITAMAQPPDSLSAPRIGCVPLSFHMCAARVRAQVGVLFSCESPYVDFGIARGSGWKFVFDNY